MEKIGMTWCNTKEDLLNSGYRLYECIRTTENFIDLTSPCRRLIKGQIYLISSDGCACTDCHIPIIVNCITKEQLDANFKAL